VVIRLAGETEAEADEMWSFVKPTVSAPFDTYCII